MLAVVAVLTVGLVSVWEQRPVLHTLHPPPHTPSPCTHHPAPLHPAPCTLHNTSTLSRSPSTCWRKRSALHCTSSHPGHTGAVDAVSAEGNLQFHFPPPRAASPQLPQQHRHRNFSNLSLVTLHNSVFSSQFCSLTRKLERSESY